MTHRKSSSHPRRSRRAFSLVEMIITSLLVGVIAIGIVPLFTRSVANNIYGADASQLASFLRSGAERLQQVSAGDTVLGVDSNVGTNPAVVPGGPDPDDFVFSDAYATRSVPTFYDTGARNSITKADDTLGDEQWRAEGSTPTGIFMWRMRREIREYSVADIFRGNISVMAKEEEGGEPPPPPALMSVGHPKLFDSPLPLTGLADIKEFRMVVESTRGGIGNEAAATASGIKQKAIVMNYRAF